MQERKLKFRTNDSENLIPIDMELIAKAKKTYDTMRLNISFMIEQWQKGELQEGMYETHLRLTEVYAKEFTALFDYSGILKKEAEERFLEIRGLNEENRELRRQLGEKVSNEDLRERTKNIVEQFKKWWNIYGWGHCAGNNIGLTGYGEFYATLSGATTHAYYAKNGELPEGYCKQDMLRAMGFELDNSKRSDNRLLSTDKNIELLKTLLTSKFPSAKLEEIKTMCYDGESPILNDIKIRITNLDDFTES